MTAAAPTILKEAILELRRLRERNARLERSRNEAVAVVGMACRYAGNTDAPDRLWNALRNGFDAVSEVPSGRWNLGAFYDPDPKAPGKTYCRHGSFLERPFDFDPTFFGMSPREAASVDPQQRLLLELAWEAIEHAGYDPRSLRERRVGIFVGIGSDDYAHLTLRDANGLDAYSGTGTSRSMAAGRLAYVLGTHGPAVQIDTSCSSSLVALHIAAASLRNGECDAALVGGANLLLHPISLVLRSQLRALSGSGRCRTFDASADGFVPGEGGGMVFLKLASDAVRDHDRVMAEVVGSAVNHDGASSGLTAPSQRAQRLVIEEALARAGVLPDRIGFVEAHGTGTKLGDPVEVSALEAVYATRTRTQPLLLGSVKTNFGHLEAAAGILAFSKAVLSVEQGEVAPNLHLSEPNPLIGWRDLPFQIPTSIIPWSDPDRHASVSSFGMSGTNCHVVIRRADSAPSASSQPSLKLWTLSARSLPELRAVAHRHSKALRSAPDQFAELAFTACAGRTPMGHRLACVADSAEAMVAQLEDFFAKGANHPCYAAPPGSSRAPVAFLLGSSNPTDVLRLYESFRPYAEVIDRAATATWRCHGLDLKEALFRRNSATKSGPLEQHSVRTAAQLAAAALWTTLGVKPAAIVDDGTSATAAACLAGRISEQDAFAQVSGTLPTNGESNEIELVTVQDMRLGEELHALRGRGYGTFLDLAPGRRLAPEQMAHVGMQTEGDSLHGFLHQASALFLLGYTLNWEALRASTGLQRARLPTYPFERKPFVASSAAHEDQSASETRDSQSPLDQLVLELESMLTALTQPPSSPSTPFSGASQHVES